MADNSGSNMQVEGTQSPVICVESTDWVVRVANECQVLAIDATSQPWLVPETLRRFTEVPESSCPVYRTLAATVISITVERLCRDGVIGRSEQTMKALSELRSSSLLNESSRGAAAWNNLVQTLKGAIGQHSDTPPLICRATGLINARFAEHDLSIREVAAQLNVSHGHLAHVLKKSTQQSFTQIVRETRLRAARQLILRNTMSIKEIAWQVGYTTTSLFDRHFKRTFCITPCEIRDSIDKQRPARSHRKR